MPGCAAVGCNNRSEKGYIMKCFPRDPKLRKIWQERVARADWEPSNNSFLCHVHFEPQEWAITQSGRIRLKKNAVPSIFTVTSTRKSPKKPKKVVHVKKGKDSQNKLGTEFLEVETENSSTGHLEGKDSDYHDIDDITSDLSGCKESKHFSDLVNLKNKNSKCIPSEMHNNKTQKQSIILISDESNLEVDTVLEKSRMLRSNDGSNKINGSNENKDFTKEHIANPLIKSEVKAEILDHNHFNDSYDEIEEKLKQICDGRSMDEMDCTTYKSSAKHEIGNILTNNRENVEIIFGTESGDEKIQAQSISFASYPILKDDKFPNSMVNEDEMIFVKEEEKIYTEDIEENFSKDEVHVIPNIRAAMKRKRRTREEIMKSIKKSIGSASEQDINAASNSDISDDMTDRENDLQIHFSKSKNAIHMDCNKEGLGRTEFTIKVTGNPEDVSDIMQELTSKGDEIYNLQEVQDSSKNCDNKNVITSVVTLKNCSVSLPNKSNKKRSNYHENMLMIEENQIPRKRYTNSNEPMKRLMKIEEKLTNSNELDLVCNSLNYHSIYLNNSTQYVDAESKNLNSHNDPQVSSFTPNSVDRSVLDISYEYDVLQQKSQIQEEVIDKLTNQLIIYKDIENNLKNQNSLLEAKTKEVEILTHKLNVKTASTQNLVYNKKSSESMQALIERLSTRVTYLEGANKKLMKTITLESQHKRKLEGHIKQKDDQIKELNWKLEKASKYLERAEKNTNTYRRKMLNMQTIMRRKKLLDEKMSRFNELLIDSSKNKFWEKGLTTALAIRKDCGTNGYNKLLSYGFPLPPLTALKKFHVDDLSDYNDSEEEVNQNTSTKGMKSKSIRVKDEIEADTKELGVPELDTRETELNGVETITGTVQDIFNENNDGDDFTSSELREHFIMQLNAVM